MQFFPRYQGQLWNYRSKIPSSSCDALHPSLSGCGSSSSSSAFTNKPLQAQKKKTPSINPGDLFPRSESLRHKHGIYWQRRLSCPELSAPTFGVFHVFVVYTLLDTLANRFGGGGDRSGVVRNLFCAAGFSCYFSGALSIAIGRDQYISTKAYRWTFLLAVGILATTIQTQEFRDEEGDRARGRSTLVTVWGRKLALWTVIVTVPFWSLFAPMVFFSGHWTLAVLPVVLGGNLVITALKALSVESSVDDRRMYIFWCLWMCAFCPLPMMKTAWSQEI